MATSCGISFRHRLQHRLAAVLLVLLSMSTTLAGATDTDKITLSQKEIDKIAERAAQKAAGKVVKLLNLTKAEETDNLVKEALKEKKEAVSHLTDKATNSDLMAIGTGVVGGNYFVLGELVGGVISHPVGSLPCGAGGTCGVPNLQTLNITSAGSVANLAALKSGAVTSGFVQSDVAYWAYTGTGLFESKEKMADLRAIASLYPEAVHIVVRKAAKINSVHDLKGKRVSVGARKSGTLLQARLVLEAYNLSEDDLETQYLNNQQSIEKLENGELEAMFFSVGVPAPALSQLFSENDAFSLLSLSDTAQQSIFKHGSYFSPFVIEANTYPDVERTETISVFALWLCSAKQDDKLIYQMTRALWDETSRQLLDSSYIGQKVTIDNSLQGIGIPLHDGAKKYYNEIGKRY